MLLGPGFYLQLGCVCHLVSDILDFLKNDSPTHQHTCTHTQRYTGYSLLHTYRSAWYTHRCMVLCPPHPPPHTHMHRCMVLTHIHKWKDYKIITHYKGNSMKRKSSFFPCPPALSSPQWQLLSPVSCGSFQSLSISFLPVSPFAVLQASREATRM